MLRAVRQFRWNESMVAAYPSGLSLTADISYGMDISVGAYITFRASRNGVLMAAEYPEEEGASWSKEIAGSKTFYANRLLEKRKTETHGELIRALHDGDLTGRAAEGFVWKIFCDLVLLDRKDEWVASLNNDFLNELRSDLLAGH